MKIWIYFNGIQQGPYTFDQIKLLPLQPTTPVWYEGLPKWVPAAEAPLTAVLFAPPASTEPTAECGQPQPREDEGCPRQDFQPFAQQPYTQQPYMQQPYMQQPYAQQQQYGQPQYGRPSEAEPPKRPSTYMGWCIVLTVLCCSPFALAGIITGSISSSRYNTGDYEGAKRMSTATEWLLIISIVWAIIGLPVALAFDL